MIGPDDLDGLTSGELHERAVALAKHRLDVRFFWRLFETIPEARAIAGELDTADVQRASNWLYDFRNADAALDDALRPLYVDYLVKHEKSST